MLELRMSCRRIWRLVRVDDWGRMMWYGAGEEVDSDGWVNAGTRVVGARSEVTISPA